MYLVLDYSTFRYDYIPECVPKEGILGRRPGHVNFINVILEVVIKGKSNSWDVRIMSYDSLVTTPNNDLLTTLDTSFRLLETFEDG